MEDSTAQVFWLGYHSLMFLTLAGVIGALPVLLGGAQPRRRPRRFLATVAGGYLLAALALGFYSYYFVPSQYTRDLDFTGLPHTWSLGESHSHSLDKADSPSTEPDEVRWRREQVARERAGFLGLWVTLAAGGFAVTLTAVAITWLLAAHRGGSPSIVAGSSGISDR